MVKGIIESTSSESEAHDALNTTVSDYLIDNLIS